MHLKAVVMPDVLVIACQHVTFLFTLVLEAQRLDAVFSQTISGAAEKKSTTLPEKGKVEKNQMERF